MSLSLGLKDFLLQSSSVFNGFPGILCDPLLPLPLLCSKAGFAGLLVGYLQLLPLCIDVSRAFQRLVFSICQYLELFLPLKYEGSLYFKVSQLLHVKVLPPAQLDWIWYSSAPASVWCCCHFLQQLLFSLGRLAVITSISRWWSGGQSGSCLFRWTSSRTACGRLSVERASLQWQNQRRSRCPVASLHCPSWCHMLLSPWPFRSSCCHFQHLPRDLPPKYSSHDAVCSPVLIQALREGVLAVLLTVVCWCVTLDDSCVDVSPFESHFYEPAFDWLPLQQALLEIFLEHDGWSLMALVISSGI